MKKLSFYFKTHNEYSKPITEHDFLLRCIPQELPEQKLVNLFLDVKPLPTGGNFGQDSFGNRTYVGRLPEPHKVFNYTIRGVAIRDDSLKEECDPPLPIYTFPSALTKPPEILRELLRDTPHDEDILRQALLFRESVYRSMAYKSEVTDVKTTAAEAIRQHAGVCQDFTHVFLALCRMRGIPSRYVSGIPEGEGASHAWAEVWYQGKWYGIDATRNCPADETYLKFCTGRDFSDCPIEQGIFWGAGYQKQEVYTTLKEMPPEE